MWMLEECEEKKYEVPVNVVFPYIAVSRRVLQGGTGGEGGGCSWSQWEIARRCRSCLFCGRQSQRMFKNTWGVGICIRFFTRWFYCMPYEEMNQHFILSFFPVTFCSLFLLGRSFLRLMCKPTVKERKSCSQQEWWEP